MAVLLLALSCDRSESFDARFAREFCDRAWSCDFTELTSEHEDPLACEAELRIEDWLPCTADGSLDPRTADECLAAFDATDCPDFQGPPAVCLEAYTCP